MKYTKITVSGRICSGKTTLLKKLERYLHWKSFHAGQFFRDYVKKHGLVLEQADEQNENLTKKVDHHMHEILKKKSGNYIFDSWMAGLMADHYSHVLRILLLCDDSVRIKRFAVREKVSLHVAEKEIHQRELNLFNKLAAIYHRNDFVDPKNYSLVIDTTHLGKDEIFTKVRSFILQ